MTHGHVFLAVDLQHGTWSIFYFHILHKRTLKQHCFVHWLLLILLWWFPHLPLLYGTLLFLQCPFISYFQMFKWSHILTDLLWIFQYGRTRSFSFSAYWCFGVTLQKYLEADLWVCFRSFLRRGWFFWFSGCCMVGFFFKKCSLLFAKHLLYTE